MGKSKHLSTETHQYQNSNTETMNSMIMSSRKALVAKPTQSRRVASKATRRPVDMAGMKVLKPEKKCECLSYLPPLSDDEISRQIDYLVGNGWAPCIEFASQEEADTNQLLFAGPALYEIQNCQDEYPGYRVRVVGFDNVRQCQMAGFI